jgi:ketosteroid isomerase-like protein
MRRALTAAFLASVVLASVASHAQGAAVTTARPAEEQRVLVAEDEYVAAEVARDEATLRRLVDDRFAFNSGKGTVTGKEEFIQSVLRMAMVGQAIRERSVLLEGDIALVFGTADLRFGGEGKDETLQSLRYTSTYVKRGGQWRMLALQLQPRASR